MTQSWQPTGDIDSALTHCMMFGLAAILEDAGVDRVRFWWTEDAEPQARFASPLGANEIGGAVIRHAQDRLAEGSWLLARAPKGAPDAALFSPRSKAPALGQWPGLVAARALARPDRGWEALDERLIGALGEPSWWRHVAGDSPDAGASRWEMKTRNRGEEFVSHRLAPLAKVVAERDAATVWAGLTGAALVDEMGRGQDSRTSTGLTTPGPVDSAVAWCALWGLSTFPTVHRMGSISHSAGMDPLSVTHPRRAVIPVFTRPVSVGKLRSLMVSRRLQIAAYGVEEVAVKTARSWLTEQGVRALVRFEIRKEGSASAPERQILAGDLETLWPPPSFL